MTAQPQHHADESGENTAYDPRFPHLPSQCEIDRTYQKKRPGGRFLVWAQAAIGTDRAGRAA